MARLRSDIRLRISILAIAITLAVGDLHDLELAPRQTDKELSNESQSTGVQRWRRIFHVARN